MPHDRASTHLANLRRHRNRPSRDVTLGFLKQTFERDIARPHRQLAALVELWEQLVPEELASHARLESLQRGVLRVSVDAASWHYQLDRLLRSGLQRELITRFKGGTLRRVMVKVSSFGEDTDGR